MYLEKTAAAISSLQKIHRKNNSPQSPLSPIRKTAPTCDFTTSTLITRNNYDKSVNLRPMNLHKRNKSLDVTHNNILHNNKGHNDFYDPNALFDAEDFKEQLIKRHTRHNSYENQQIQLPSPKHNTVIDQTNLQSQQRAAFMEQQRLLNKYFNNNNNISNAKVEEHARRLSIDNNLSGSPIRRSSSFCNKNNKLIKTSTIAVKSTTPTANKKQINRRMTANTTSANHGNVSSLQKSASSSSFKNMIAANTSSSNHSSYSQNYDNIENESYYINGKDNLHPTQDDLLYSTDDSDEMNSATGESSSKYESDRQTSTTMEQTIPISHTRYNKAFLMRMEQNKQIANSGNKGVIACPNTPEMPRRSNQRASFRDPTSMPRDSSLSRMKQELPNLQTTKKVLAQSTSKDSSSSTSSIKQRILPKYMDISKYKPVQGQHFLKRDESKSTLINRNEIRKSPSAIGLSKSDPMRTSGRVKSAGAKPSTPINAKGKVYSH